MGSKYDICFPGSLRVLMALAVSGNLESVRNSPGKATNGFGNEAQHAHTRTHHSLIPGRAVTLAPRV